MTTHFANFTFSLSFYYIPCQYLQLFYKYNPIYLDLLLLFLVFCFALACSFKDPGIVTFRSNLFQEIEEYPVPEGIDKGTEYYKYFKKDKILCYLLTLKASKGYSLSLLQQLC